MFVVSLVALVTGLGMAAWAVVEPQPAKYIVGVVLVAAGLAIQLYRAQCRRAERAQGVRRTGWRLRLRAGGLGGAVAVLLAVVLIGAPHLAHRAETDSAVIWTADRIRGQLMVVDGTVYAAEAIDETLGSVDVDDGSLAWELSGGTWLPQDGGVIAVDSDELSRYTAEGDLKWQLDLPGGQDEFDGVFAARDGYVVYASCDSEERPDCHLVGIDPSGQEAWQRELDTAHLERWDFLASEGEVLPTVVTVPQAERGLLIDPESGEVLGGFPMEHVREQHVYGDVLVTGGGSGSECRLDGYRITDGEHLWRADELCSSEEYVYPLPPHRAGTDALAYAVVEASTEPQALLAMDVADGTVQEVPSRDFGASASERPLDVWDFSAGGLVFRSSTVDVTASEALTLQRRWQLESPGVRVRSVTGDSETAVIISAARAAEHNPMVAPLADESERDFLQHPAYVTVVDADSGEIISTTLVPEGVSDVRALPGHRVLVNTFDALMLLGEE